MSQLYHCRLHDFDLIHITKRLPKAASEDCAYWIIDLNRNLNRNLPSLQSILLNKDCQEDARPELHDELPHDILRYLAGFLA